MHLPHNADDALARPVKMQHPKGAKLEPGHQSSLAARDIVRSLVITSLSLQQHACPQLSLLPVLTLTLHARSMSLGLCRALFSKFAT